MSFNVKERLRAMIFILPSAVSIGLAMRFWRAVFTGPPPMTIDWTPAIYFLLGLLSSTISFQIVLKNRGPLPPTSRRVLIGLDGGCFAGYLFVVAFLFWRAFSRLS